MTLALTNLGAVFAGLKCVLRKLFDAVNADWMVGCESANHDREDRILAWVGHQQSSHGTSSVVRTETSCEQILHSDLISSCLARSLKSRSLKPRSLASVVALGILKMSDFMCDYKAKLAGRIVENLHQRLIEKDFVSWDIRKGVHILPVGNFCRELGHRVLERRTTQSGGEIVHESTHLVLGLTDTKRSDQNNQQCVFHGFLSALRYVHRACALLLQATLIDAPRNQSEQEYQNNATQQIVRALASPWRVLVQIGYGCGDATARHGANIFRLARAWWNGTSVPRTASETA